MSYYGPGVTDPTGLAQVLPGSSPGAARAAQPTAGGGSVRRFVRRVGGALLLIVCTAIALSLLSWSIADPSLTHAASGHVANWMGALGAIVSDLLVQMLGLTSIIAVLPPVFWALTLANQGFLPHPKRKLIYAPLAVLFLALAWSSLPLFGSWPLKHGFGGMLGDLAYNKLAGVLAIVNTKRAGMATGLFGAALGAMCLQRSFGLTRVDLALALRQWPGRESKSTAPAASVTLTATAVVAPSLALEPQPWQHSGLPAHAQPAAAPVHCAPPTQVHIQPVYQFLAWPQPFAPAPQRRPFAPPTGQLNVAPMQPAPAPTAAPRQAWLRPFPHRTPAAQPVARATPEAARSLPATSRSHAPGFDQETAEQSRAIAERFAPAAGGVGVSAQPSQHVEDAWAAHAKAHRLTPVAQPAPVVHPVREPAIIMPAVPPAGSASPIAPGGFYDRLTGGDRRHEAGPQAYKRPSLNLLRRAPIPTRAPETSAAQLRDRAQLLLETLADFGVKGEIVAVRPGPVVTLFEFEPARGTKSSRVIGLSDDVARSMSARAVRIAVVPGVNAIGIELPNATREAVALRDLLEADPFRKTEAALPLALGRSIGGEPVVADLAKMPHLLVAGTTGAGKSVGVNAMILSLLYHLSPEQCRLILIDPKMLELSVYNNIPHLLTPVVTEPNKAVAALNWAVGEMEARYKRMSALSVRNIDVYNNRVRNGRKREDLLGSSTARDFDPMPHIVIVVDEFADLMAVAGKEIEFAVQRLAQMARAAGIHLIMATQRPSVDIITGTIKANFPTRISFRVTSRIDSRTILNEQGAEQLLGQGDMLYAGGSGQIVRVHGPYVSDEEVEAIANYLRSLGAPDYVEGLTDTPDPEGASKASEALDEDDLYDRAVALVRTDRKASTSYLQRRLGIGYNRAAGIIERMEADGLVGPANGAGKRDVLEVAAAAVAEPDRTYSPGA